MKILFRILSILLGSMFAWNAIGFVIDPAAASGGLGMELLTGLGASTQIGDIGAFFWGVAIAIGIGQLRGKSDWFLVAVLLLGAAALMRTIAWMLGHADFATAFIVVEVVAAGILGAAAWLRRDEPASSSAVLPEA